MKMMYRMQEKTSPCPTPVWVGMGSLLSPLTCTVEVRVAFQCASRLMSRGGKPRRLSVAQSTSPLTLSYAFLKSTQRVDVAVGLPFGLDGL